jgi:hypothetical protein
MKVLKEDPLWRPDFRWENDMAIQVDLRETGCEFNQDRIGCNNGSCGHTNKISVSIKDREITLLPGRTQVLNKESAAYILLLILM